MVTLTLCKYADLHPNTCTLTPKFFRPYLIISFLLSISDHQLEAKRTSPKPSGSTNHQYAVCMPKPEITIILCTSQLYNSLTVCIHGTRLLTKGSNKIILPTKAALTKMDPGQSLRRPLFSSI